MNITCFLSHSWQNGQHDFALKLADALESHGIKNAWIDEREIPGGGHIEDRIRRGVQDCDVFLFLISPASLTSKWCNLELQEAFRQRFETGIQIIPILLRDLTGCSIPEMLQDLLYIDFRNKSEFDKSSQRLLTSIKKVYLVRATVLEILEGDNHTRLEAAQKLALLKDRFTVPILSRHLDPKTEPDPTVRHWLAQALGQIGGEEACAALRAAALGETHPFAKRGIDQALKTSRC